MQETALTMFLFCFFGHFCVLQVSSSCTSVYLDGSEVHGSQNATVAVEYSTYRGYGHFTVWEPVLPLDVRAVDPKLSVIKGWKTPFRHMRWVLRQHHSCCFFSCSFHLILSNLFFLYCSFKLFFNYSFTELCINLYFRGKESQVPCVPKFQQTQVKVSHFSLLFYQFVE
jgi:hypothetical protein